MPSNSKQFCRTPCSSVESHPNQLLFTFSMLVSMVLGGTVFWIGSDDALSSRHCPRQKQVLDNRFGMLLTFPKLITTVQLVQPKPDKPKQHNVLTEFHYRMSLSRTTYPSSVGTDERMSWVGEQVMEQNLKW